VSYYLLFTLICASGVVPIFAYVSVHSDWNPYTVWLVALGAVTFGLYGLDKLLAKLSGPRVPERLLHMLALLGGVAGAWLGMWVFRHKSNLRKHPRIWGLLALASVVHVALTCRSILVGNS